MQTNNEHFESRHIVEHQIITPLLRARGLSSSCKTTRVVGEEVEQQ